MRKFRASRLHPFFSVLACCCSAVFGFCCLWLAGCAARDSRRQHQELLQAQSLAARYGIFETHLSRSYLSYLQQRLSRALADYQGRNNVAADFSAVILNTPEPLAVSAGAGSIFLSKGLIMRLQNEAELAFVIAHEMAHQALAHSAAETASHSSYARELDADKSALGFVALAGYDIRLVPMAIIHAYSYPPRETLSAHPPLEERIKALQAIMRQSSWTPPGSQDRRVFHELQMELALR